MILATGAGDNNRSGLRSARSVARSQPSRVARCVVGFRTVSAADQFWRKKEILVTGGGGFLGRHLVRRLDRLGAELLIPVRSVAQAEALAGELPRARVEVADLRDEARLVASIDAFRPALAFHLATRSGHPADQAAYLMSLQESSLAAINLFRGLSSVGRARVVLAGSSLVYAERPEPLSPEDPLGPDSWRGLYKAHELLLCRRLAREHGRHLSEGRIFTAYGPGDAAAKLIPTAIRAVLGRKSMRLTQHDCERDFIHVEDVVEALLSMARADLRSGSVLNIGSGTAHTSRQVVELIGQLAGVRIAVEETPFPPRPSDRRRQVADISRTVALLGWRPTLMLADGLRATIAHARNGNG